jgi:hypothetical protein
MRSVLWDTLLPLMHEQRTMITCSPVLNGLLHCCCHMVKLVTRHPDPF